MLSVVVVGEDKTGWRLAERTGLCLLGFHMRSLWREISNVELSRHAGRIVAVAAGNVPGLI